MAKKDCRAFYATVCHRMSETARQEQGSQAEGEPLYCPSCAREVRDPLTCGDCSAVICRACGTPLESADELGMG